MNKWLKILFVILILLETFFLFNKVHKEIKFEKIEISQMNIQLSQIKRNITDILEQKKSQDFMFISEQCTLFLHDIENYKMKHKNIEINNLVKLIQEYKKLIFEINENGYNDNIEKKIRNFEKCFDVIDVDVELSVADFNESLKNFNKYMNDDSNGGLSR